MTLQQAVERASQSIARRDAESLIFHLTGRDRAWLLAHPEAALAPEQQERFLTLVQRRAAHWPLQYLTGRQEFFGLDLQLSQDVLIPRPETELLVEAVLDWTRAHAPGSVAGSFANWRIVDVGTGSGAVALALAHHLPDAQVWALDISPAVQPIVEHNAQSLGLSQRVRFLHSDLLTVFSDQQSRLGGFDIIVSNPPYVPTGDAAEMQPEVRDFEPHLALFAGQDGLSIYRRLIPQARAALRPRSLLAMEFGYGQREALASLLLRWQNVHFKDDYAGIPRIATAERP